MTCAYPHPKGPLLFRSNERSLTRWCYWSESQRSKICLSRYTVFECRVLRVFRLLYPFPIYLHLHTHIPFNRSVFNGVLALLAPIYPVRPYVSSRLQRCLWLLMYTFLPSVSLGILFYFISHARSPFYHLSKKVNEYITLWV